ncbi:glutamine synthetase [Rhodobacteraceae bacterium CY05]|uniref:Glutamine synthetase n=2 Tax=Parasedimentitalea huanghaiensis TaxID=2682100 RepID=A0A6L6WLW5_9RHOB|nr:glutamine synthetase [Zongyanglinia huanghaiensis]
MRGKRIPATQWERTCKDGNAIIAAMFALDMTSDVWDTPYCSFDNGYVDMHMFPLNAPVACPFEPGVAITLAYAEGMDHQPVPIDPRGALLKQVERAAAQGYQVQVGTELEFYLLDPETGLPTIQGNQVYGINRMAELEHVLGPIREDLTAMGIPIEQSNPEYAAGQVEVNIRYDEAVLAADRIILFRAMVKQVAAKHGYLATFMAKPFIAESGSGFHTHYSLWKDGKNAFAQDGKINQTGLAFVAGLQNRMVEMSLAGSTTPNAYKRRQPYTFCPVNNSWGYDNRTVGLRVIEGGDSAVRVEKRDASADVNPYYLLACDIAAGLEGIENGSEPGPVTKGDAYADNPADMLPLTLDEAVAQAKNSTFMSEVYGQDRLDIAVKQSEREIEFVRQQVTAVETERYLRNL